MLLKIVMREVLRMVVRMVMMVLVKMFKDWFHDAWEVLMTKGFTDRCTDIQTFAIVELLLWLKTLQSISFECWLKSQSELTIDFEAWSCLGIIKWQMLMLIISNTNKHKRVLDVGWKKMKDDKKFCQQTNKQTEEKKFVIVESLLWLKINCQYNV